MLPRGSSQQLEHEMQELGDPRLSHLTDNVKASVTLFERVRF